jgi:hypothetical protein
MTAGFPVAFAFSLGAGEGGFFDYLGKSHNRPHPTIAPYILISI